MNIVNLLLVNHAPQYMFGVMVFWVLVLMQWQKKLPSVDSIQQFATVINSRGGNIVWLGVFSLIFFFSSVSFAYWVLNHVVDGKISESNAIVLATFTFMTGSAFGGAFTSMVKAMTGEVPAPPSPPGGGSSTTVQSTSTTTAPAIPPSSQSAPESGS